MKFYIGSNVSLLFRDFPFWYLILFVFVCAKLFILIIILCILRIMEIIRNFDVVFAIYQGGPGSSTETLPIAVWRMFMSQRQVGMGSAFSFILILLL